MKKIILIGILAGLVVGATIWVKHKDGDTRLPTEAPADEEGAGVKVTHDANGNVIVNINDETQGNIGLKVAHPEATQLSPELKGYGRVLDPVPLATLLTELSSTRAAYAASSNELVRLKTLEGQGNASTRALQTGEAAAARDQLAAQSAHDRLALSWGAAVADRNDLPAFVQSLTSLNSALVRIDLPAGEAPSSAPSGARIIPLSVHPVEAAFLGAASDVDPQTQGHGFIFLVKSNDARLLTGEAVTGFLKVSGEPQAGVVIPRDSVVRMEGAGWVYVQSGDGESYTRTQIPLDHATDTGWFITNGLTAQNYIVTTGAQILLSEELKGAIKPD